MESALPLASQAPLHSEARMDAVFTALADPTRRAILRQLARGDASVAQLSAPFTISQPAITKHLRMLERAGLITRSVHRQSRPARLAAQPMAEAAQWLLEFSQFWQGSLDELDKMLGTMQQTENKDET